MAIDRGVGHPANRGTDLPEAPPPPAKAPAGMSDLAAAIRQRRLPDPETGQLATGTLVLQCGPGVVETLAVYSMRPEFLPDVAVRPGSGLSYRRVSVHIQFEWGGRWRLLDDGEVASGGEILPCAS